MPLAPAVSALAQQTMRTAFESLERTVTPADSRTIRSSALHHVRTAALELENQLAARQALCNMRRLAPLLNGLEHYSRVVDILCNGTPFLPWIWAPITLILRVASEYAEAFEQILRGYSKIAGALGRFEILSDAFITEADFQQTLAVFYADILQYHKHAYKFVRRSGWRLLFATSWGRFQGRFDNILENLDRHGKLVDQEANARNIAAASQLRREIRTWREESLEQLKINEERQAAREFTSILSWLKVDEREQIQIFETISDEGTKFPGTCSWLLKNEKIKSWLQKKPDPPLLWLQGNPGCGKSVIAAKLVDFLQASRSSIVHHFCAYTYPSSTKYDGILRSILQQLLRKSGELVAHVYQDYIVGKKPPTTANLERLIEILIIALSDEPRESQYMWIIIDGINECEAARQTRLISLMNQISSISSSTWGAVCKVLITTRPSPIVNKYFRKDCVMFLSDEKSPLQSAIRKYVSQRLGLQPLQDRFRQLELEANEIEEIELLVSKKAGGMFLYARLVLDYISANLFYDGNELKDAINQLPETLAEFYHKLLAQILVRLSEQSQDRVRCIFSWVAFAKRPLKKLEFLSALSFTSGNPELTKLVPRYIVEDICSPLIEERRDTSLAFIHVSVKHFLQSSSSAITLKEDGALREHGVAAVSCLVSGLQVFSNLYNEQTRLLRLIKGVHGFHVYATEYWTEYLLANAAISGGLEGSPDLLDPATQLAEALDRIGNAAPLKWKVSSSSVDSRLRLLEQYPVIKKHVEQALLARSQKRLESELFQDLPVNEKDPSTMSNYLDGVSITLNRYQKAVETLLDQDSCPGASVEELDFFKSQFRTSAYTCRLRSCPRATIGFETALLRREHEIAHAGGFRCTFQNCQYPPFRSSKALAAHTASNHLPQSTLPRKSIRKVGHLDLSERLNGVNGAKNADDILTTQLNRGKNPASTDVKLNPSAIQWPLTTQSKGEQSQSPPSSPRKSSRAKRLQPTCLECSTKGLRCNKALPTCASCKRWSRVCIYPDSCEQCVVKGLKCDKSQPICKVCKSSSTKCSYTDSAKNGGNDIVPATVASKQISLNPQEDLRGPSNCEDQAFGSDLLGSSGIGVGYLDIILYELAGGVAIDPALFDRVKDSFNNNMSACFELGEIVDNLKTGSLNGLSPDQIVTQLWSGDPELERELRQLLTTEAEPYRAIESMSDNGKSDDEATLHEPHLHCICGKEESGMMIVCSNLSCPRQWFHLHCVNLVVTPDQDEEWFCSSRCRKALETATCIEQVDADCLV